MSNKYTYDKENNRLLILHNPRNASGTNKGVTQFCKDYQISLEEFNIPIVIDKKVKNCASLLEGCTKFNQKVEIPEGVENCKSMFKNCETFNQPVHLPNSLRNCKYMFCKCKLFNQEVFIPDQVEEGIAMFCGCESLNQEIHMPKNITDTSLMFKNCKKFNQKVEIPEGVTDCWHMFENCEIFNQPVHLPNSLEKCESMFRNCKLFNQKVDISEKATLCSQMFEGCSEFNQSVILGEGVTHGYAVFMDCKKLNQPIEICTRDGYCADIFKGCDSLEAENVTIHCKRIRALTLKKRLEEMWGTKKVKKGTNIVYDKVKKEVNILEIECKLTKNEKINILKEEIQQLTEQGVHQKLQELFEQKKIVTLEISERSDGSMKVLTVEFEYPLFAIAVIDEWTDAIYYYNSGKGKKREAEINGNVYPMHMVSEDRDILFQIIDDFMKTGRPSKKVRWKRQ